MRHPRNSFRLGQWAVSTKHHQPLSLFIDMIFCSLSRATLLNRLNLDLRRCLVWLKSNYLFFLVYADLCFYSAATALWRRLLDLPFLKEKKKVFSISLFWRIQNNKSFPPFLLFNFRSLSNRLPHQLNFVLLFSPLVSTLLCVLSQSWIGANIRIVIGILLSCGLSRVFQ